MTEAYFCGSIWKGYMEEMPQKMLEAAGKENFSDKVRGAPSEPLVIHVSQDLSEKELAEGL